MNKTEPCVPSIEEWLNGLDLGKYSKVFAENDVDLRALPHLNDADLHELGVSLGHRKVMLAAISQLRAAAPAEIEREAEEERRGSIVDGQPESAAAGGRARSRPQAAQRPLLRHGRIHEPIGAPQCGRDA